MFLLKRDWPSATVLIALTAIITSVCSPPVASAETDPPVDDGSYLDHTNQDWVDLPPLLPHTNQDLFGDRNAELQMLLIMLEKYAPSRPDRNRLVSANELDLFIGHESLYPSRAIQMPLVPGTSFALLTSDPNVVSVVPEAVIDVQEQAASPFDGREALQPIIRMLVRTPDVLPKEPGTRRTMVFAGDQEIDTSTIPAPGALLMLGMAGLLGSRRRGRRA